MGKHVYKGRFIEKNGDKILYDYLVSINLEPISKGRLPIVKELEGKILNNLENHKYEDNNSFCFGVGLHEKIIYRRMIEDFEWFVEKQIKGFLGAAAHMDIYGVWGADEFSHDEIKARQESITRLIGFYNFKESGLKLLEKNIISNEGYCYCGSNKFYKNCHITKIREISKYINKIDLLQEIKLLEKKYKGE